MKLWQSVALVTLSGGMMFPLYALQKPDVQTDAPSAETGNLKNKLKSLKQNETFVQNGTEYIFYPELRAEFKKKGAHKENTLRGFQLSGTPFYKSKNFVVSKAPQSSLLSLNTEDDQTNNLPVVFNSKTNQFGVLRGHFLIKMKDRTNFSDDSFQLARSFPEFGVYVVKMPDNQSIQESLARLKQDRNVEDVTVEVNEIFQEPM